MLNPYLIEKSLNFIKDNLSDKYKDTNGQMTFENFIKKTK